MTVCTSGGYDQLKTSPDTIEQELRPAVCELRQTDRLMENYSIDVGQKPPHKYIKDKTQGECIVTVLTHMFKISLIRIEVRDKLQPLINNNKTFTNMCERTVGPTSQGLYCYLT